MAVANARRLAGVEPHAGLHGEAVVAVGIAVIGDAAVPERPFPCHDAAGGLDRAFGRVGKREVVGEIDKAGAIGVAVAVERKRSKARYAAAAPVFADGSCTCAGAEGQGKATNTRQ